MTPTAKEIEAFVSAAAGGNKEAVEHYTKLFGPDFIDSRFNKWTAMIMAASWGHPDIAADLVKLRADVNAVGDYGHTALIRAAMWGHTEIVEMLLENGADINIRDDKGETALMHAMSSNYATPQIVSLLQKKDLEYQKWLRDTDASLGIRRNIRAMKPLKGLRS